MGVVLKIFFFWVNSTMTKRSPKTATPKTVAQNFTTIMTALTLTQLKKKNKPKTPKNIAKEFTNIMQKLQR